MYSGSSRGWGTLAYRGGVGYLPVSQAYLCTLTTGLWVAVASDRGQIKWARRQGGQRERERNGQRASADVAMTGLVASWLCHGSNWT
jgi:hypothetical protein